MVADLRFSSTDLTRLTAAVDTCVRPFDFPALAEWRSSLLDRVMDLLECPIGHFDLRGLGLEQEVLARGYEPGVFETYSRDWIHADPTYALLQRLDMTTYTRRHRHRVAGPYWTAKYRRSPVFNEFYAPNRLIDGAGILFKQEGVGVHVHAETCGLGGDLMDERGRQLLLILEPAVRASVRVIQGATGGHWRVQALLDATVMPFALLDGRSRWVHRTPALREILRALPSEAAAGLLELIEGLAQRLLQGAVTALPSVPPEPTIFGVHGFQVSGVLLGPDGPFARPYALIRLEPVASSTAAAGRARRAGLTAREAEVAMLLARGLSDKAIAARLQISWATARRHTENILRKLKIGSRGAVAHALEGLPADLD